MVSIATRTKNKTSVVNRNNTCMKNTKNTKKTITKTYTNYGCKNCAKAVWEKATIIPGENPDVFRKDVMGKIIRFDDLNSKTSNTAWNIDHVVPKTRGGSNDITNLQPMNRIDNIRFSNKLDRNKPGFNLRSYFNSLLMKRTGKNILLQQKEPLLKFAIGDIVYTRQSPISPIWKYARIQLLSQIEDKVVVRWLDANYEQELPYCSLLFGEKL